MEPIQAVVETSLYVDDLDQAKDFYQRFLGLTVVGEEKGRHVFFQVGGSMLLAFKAETTRKGDVLPAHGAQGPGHFAFGIPTDSLDSWKSRLVQMGIAIEKEVHWPRGGRSVYFRDPAGNSVELLTPGVWGLPSGW